MSLTVESTVGQWVAERPAVARVFEQVGIDYCCGGKKPLADACRAKGLDAATVLAFLNSNLAGASASVETVDAQSMTMTALADHIERTHHDYLRREFPRLQPLVEKISFKHGQHNPRIARLAAVFTAFRAELESHMAKEEQVLFPIIRQIEQGNRDSASHCGGVANPIRAMEVEHEHAGDALGEMAAMTDNFAVSDDSCNTYRAVMHSLAELTRDMHQHVHKENNVLFPRALAAEIAH